MIPILNKILGPSRSEVWKQFAEAIGADYEPGPHWFSESSIRATHRNWSIVFDAYQLPGGRFPAACTRLHAPYTSRENFRFSLARKAITLNIMKLLGDHHTNVDQPQIDSLKPLFGVGSYIGVQQEENNCYDFNEEFVVKTNNEAKLSLLLKDLAVGESIRSVKSLSLIVSDINRGREPSSRNAYELSIYANGTVRDLTELEGLYKMFVYILDNLCYIQSAVENVPLLRGQSSIHDQL